MIGPIDSRGYDCEGRVTILPEKKSLHFKPTFAMGTYFTSPFTVRCVSIEEMRQFLRKCTFASDKDQFGVGDYWMPPAEFEKRRRGDCDDFALWAWRQMLGLGYRARFVIGRAGLRRGGHAWVTFEENGSHYLLEPTAANQSRLARLTVSAYEPRVSVEAEGEKLVFRAHRDRNYSPTFSESVSLAAEWLPRVLLAQARSLLVFPWVFLKRTLGGRNA